MKKFMWFLMNIKLELKKTEVVNGKMAGEDFLGKLNIVAKVETRTQQGDHRGNRKKIRTK